MLRVVLKREGNHAPLAVGCVARLRVGRQQQRLCGRLVRLPDHLAGLDMNDLPDQMFLVLGVDLCDRLVLALPMQHSQHAVQDFG